MNKPSKEVRRKGYALFKRGDIKKELDTDKRVHFTVKGETEEHSVIFDKIKNKWFCDCRYASLGKGECSHIYAAKLLEKSKE